MQVEKSRALETLRDKLENKNDDLTLKINATNNNEKYKIEVSSNWLGRSVIWVKEHAPSVAERLPCITAKVRRERESYTMTDFHILEIVQMNLTDDAKRELGLKRHENVNPLKGITCGTAKTLIARADAMRILKNSIENSDDKKEGGGEFTTNSLNEFGFDNWSETDSENKVDPAVLVEIAEYLELMPEVGTDEISRRSDAPVDSGGDAPNLSNFTPGKGYEHSAQALFVARNLSDVEKSNRVPAFQEIIEFFIRPEIRPENRGCTAGANVTTLVKNFADTMVSLAGRIVYLPSGCESDKGKELGLIGNDVRFWAFENIRTSMLSEPYRTELSPIQRGAITVALARQLGNLPSGENNGNAGAGKATPSTNPASDIRWPLVKGFEELAKLYSNTTGLYRRLIGNELQCQAAQLPQGSAAARQVQAILSVCELVSRPG